MSDPRLKGFDPGLLARIHGETLAPVRGAAFEDTKGLDEVERRVREVIEGPLLRPDIFTVSPRPSKATSSGLVPRPDLCSSPLSCLLHRASATRAPGCSCSGRPARGRRCWRGPSHRTWAPSSPPSRRRPPWTSSRGSPTRQGPSFSPLTRVWLLSDVARRGVCCVLRQLVKVLFTLAEVHEPAVTFVDEADSLLGVRTSGRNEFSRTAAGRTTEFLTRVEGVRARGDHVSRSHVPLRHCVVSSVCLAGCPRECTWSRRPTGRRTWTRRSSTASTTAPTPRCPTCTPDASSPQASPTR
jgi:hypothetical protein